MVALRRDRQFVQEALHHEGEHVGARRPPRAAGRAPGQQGLAQAVLRGQGTGEGLWPRAVRRETALLPSALNAHQSMPPARETAVRIQARRQPVEAAGPEEVVLHVVLARPLQFAPARATRCAIAAASHIHSLTSRRPKPPPPRALVDRDALRRQSTHVREQRQGALRGLRGGPQFERAVAMPGHAALRLELRVADEGVAVVGFQGARGAGKRRLDVAARRDLDGRRPCRGCLRPRGSRRSSCPSRRPIRPTPRAAPPWP